MSSPNGSTGCAGRTAWTPGWSANCGRSSGQLNDAEQQAYLDATLPRGFDELMLALNAMDPDERRRMVDEASRRIDEQGGPPPELSDDQVQQIVDQGMKSYLSSANAQTKLDLQPLVEQMQANLQRRK